MVHSPLLLALIFFTHLAQEIPQPRISDINNDLLYTGRRRDPETGLQLNRNRFYASHLGRWVNRDPIGYYGGTNNLYEYVNGWPTGTFDPSGQGPCGMPHNNQGGNQNKGCCNGVTYNKRRQRCCKGKLVSAKHTCDEHQLLDMCEGNPTCVAEMEGFIDTLDDIDWEETPNGVGPCYEYTQGCKNQCPKNPPGDCTVEYFHGKPRSSLLVDGILTGPVKPTYYSVFGVITRGYVEHSWGQICCPQSDGSTKCMLFDVGSDSMQGQFGGSDHLFPPNHPDFNYEIDLGSIAPLQ